MAQKSEEIMPDPDAIIRLRRDRLLGANLIRSVWRVDDVKISTTKLNGVLPK